MDGFWATEDSAWVEAMGDEGIPYRSPVRLSVESDFPAGYGTPLLPPNMQPECYWEKSLWPLPSQHQRRESEAFLNIGGTPLFPPDYPSECHFDRAPLPRPPHFSRRV